MNLLSNRFEVPYYAVIFTSQRATGDQGYGQMADQMESMGRDQAGFLGIESYRESSGAGVTISYWKTLEDIRHWKSNPAHQIAQNKGKQTWYQSYSVKICKVESAYDFENM
ncbi:heme-degrading monooxygenase HmoA [Paenibacillus sp. SORGH_AS306]|uniref:antibiotic biosynthesis monooxygenase family protein n=1 Tax=unclassified Paenibacillus TaxID=185978 RepID=UPI002784EB0A|nr:MULTISPECIES: antibiotic biosynthesis monooxygenase [unclassified Paenibacillus]MDQ1233211.1 heme-degrading monooxygenase HmoA [Paenibacillus sp. SORGH_AS_0306]MDR6110256.1 heme-degrading monooxygenase HmoA [Paenibacillus sp. SORGH_AS_0338]